MLGVCACCQMDIGELRDEAEAKAEFDRCFPEYAGTEQVIVCDTCYTVLMSDNPVAELGRIVSEITGQDLN